MLANGEAYSIANADGEASTNDDYEAKNSNGEHGKMCSTQHGIFGETVAESGYSDKSMDFNGIAGGHFKQDMKENGGGAQYRFAASTSTARATSRATARTQGSGAWA